MVKHQVVRFQVWLVNLSPTRGKEITETRLCIVISPNEMAALSTVLVAPMTIKGLSFLVELSVTLVGRKG